MFSLFGIAVLYTTFMGFPGDSVVKNLPMQEIWVWSLGGEDPLEEEMTTHSSVLAKTVLWTEEPGGLQSMRSQTIWHDWMTNTSNTQGIKWELIFKQFF